MHHVGLLCLVHGKLHIVVGCAVRTMVHEMHPTNLKGMTAFTSNNK